MTQYAVLIFERVAPEDLPPESCRPASRPRRRRRSALEAADAYCAALALTDNAAEQKFLAARVTSTQPAS